jgi:hypothetical protein
VSSYAASTADVDIVIGPSRHRTTRYFRCPDHDRQTDLENHGSGLLARALITYVWSREALESASNLDWRRALGGLIFSLV